MSPQLTPYRDFWVRFSVSLFIALFLTFLGSESLAVVIRDKNFIPDVLAGFILTFTITSLINLITSYLDIHYPWHQFTATRIVYQLIAGVLIMSVLVLAYMYTYLLVIMSYPKNEVTFFNTEFPISVVFIIFWNLVYVGFYYYRIHKHQRAELITLKEKLFTLQHVPTGQEILPAAPEQAGEEQEEEESGTSETDPTEKINILIAVSGNKNIPLPVERIAYFFKSGNYATLMTFQTETYLLNHSLDELMKVLDEKRFFRANRQFIINLDACHYFTNEENGKLAITLVPTHKEKVFISQKRAPAFREWLNK